MDFSSYSFHRAMSTLGFDKYVDPLRIYLTKYRDSVKGDRPEKKSTSRKDMSSSAQPKSMGMRQSSYGFEDMPPGMGFLPEPANSMLAPGKGGEVSINLLFLSLITPPLVVANPSDDASAYARHLPSSRNVLSEHPLTSIVSPHLRVTFFATSPTNPFSIFSFSSSPCSCSFLDSSSATPFSSSLTSPSPHSFQQSSPTPPTSSSPSSSPSPSSRWPNQPQLELERRELRGVKLSRSHEVAVAAL
jgi:hypothetical protein